MVPKLFYGICIQDCEGLGYMSRMMKLFLRVIRRKTTKGIDSMTKLKMEEKKHWQR